MVHGHPHRLHMTSLYDSDAWQSARHLQTFQRRSFIGAYLIGALRKMCRGNALHASGKMQIVSDIKTADVSMSFDDKVVRTINAL
jgi:hypothetical protein